MTEYERFQCTVTNGEVYNGRIFDQLCRMETTEVVDKLNKLTYENKQLKSELSRYKEVNRLDIWKSSYSSEDALIIELQNKCDKKQEHIVVLENKIRRMREAIHKLEWLASHRNANLIRENGQLKQFIKELTTKGTGRIDLASGYSYNVSAVLTDYRGDVE